ncbi:ExbD/TolR family protein [Mucilaginibacter dorajii]|uniref:Biopolymer transporter ExbD n=1 Tax=Mucilaginibacter dorajii TaxID=692994 RepID=A0ABP7PLE3_9SPHI|nr:biopolymer transporter ExbD [Mucilaginibacter dorajii]MCS3733661.1 biopolymer transport protein ExbD [Mucilaginibacter dorajii]
MAELASSTPRSGAAHGRKKMNVRVDLTAMVDLAFLLITFFILTTTLQKTKAMDLAMPVNEGDEAVPASRSLTICLGKNNQVMYYLGELAKPIIAPTLTNFNSTGLRQTLIETGKMIRAKYGKNMIVLVKPSDHSKYSSLVSTLDELNITQTQIFSIVDIAQPDIDALKQKGVY